jgi:hypothetical protein
MRWAALQQRYRLLTCGATGEHPIPRPYKASLVRPGRERHGRTAEGRSGYRQGPGAESTGVIHDRCGRCAPQGTRRADLQRLQPERARADLDPTRDLRRPDPSLFTFFQDINYLQLCVDCVKRLVYVPRGINSTVSSSLRRRLKYVRGGECRIVIQVAEDRFISRPGSLEERADLGIRQLYACAMQTILICPKAGTRESGKEAGSKSEQGGAPQASRPCCSSRIRV